MRVKAFAAILSFAIACTSGDDDINDVDALPVLPDSSVDAIAQTQDAGDTEGADAGTSTISIPDMFVVLPHIADAAVSIDMSAPSPADASAPPIDMSTPPDSGEPPDEVIPPDSLWDVIVEEVIVPFCIATASTETCDKWDLAAPWDAGHADVYVTVIAGLAGAEYGRTETVDNVATTTTFSPTPIATISASTLQLSFGFAVYDEDIDADDWIGACYARSESLEDAWSGRSMTMDCRRNENREGFVVLYRLERH